MSSHAKPKVLIIYERSGMGHEVMANILAEQILQDAQVERYTISELLRDPLTEGLTKIWVKAWNIFMRRNWIKAADAFINYGMRLTLLPIGEVSAVAAVHEALDQLSPDILICTADSAGKCLGSWAKEKQVPFFLMVTDLSIFIDLVSPEATHLCYFPETINAIQSFPFRLPYWSYNLTRLSSWVEKVQFIAGYFYDFVIHYSQNKIYRNIDQNYLPQNQARCHAIGLLREPKHFIPRSRETLRVKLGLPLTAVCILVISGSLGGNFCLQSLRALQSLSLDALVVIVACGKDENLRTKVDSITLQAKDCKMRSLGFVDNLHEWMSAVDVILARPSAGILLESLLARTPLLLPKQAAANDRGAISFIEKYRLGECYYDLQDLKLKLNRLLTDKNQYQNQIDTLLKKYSSTFEEQRTILREILLGSINDK